MGTLCLSARKESEAIDDTCETFNRCSLQIGLLPRNTFSSLELLLATFFITIILLLCLVSVSLKMKSVQLCIDHKRKSANKLLESAWMCWGRVLQYEKRRGKTSIFINCIILIKIYVFDEIQRFFLYYSLILLIRKVTNAMFCQHFSVVVFYIWKTTESFN